MPGKVLVRGGRVQRGVSFHSFPTDEECSGVRGMQWFVKSKEFRALNVGFALDEGYANPGEECFLFYGDRCPWSECVQGAGFFSFHS